MKFKPFIDTEEIQSRSIPWTTRMAFWVKERAKILGGVLAGLIIATLILTVNAVYSKMNEEKAAALYLQSKNIEDFIQVLQRYPDSVMAPLAIYALAQAYEEKEDWSQAETYYRLFAEKYPNHFLLPNVRFALAFLAEQKGETEKALSLYRELHVSPQGEAFGAEITAAIARCNRRLGQAGSS